MSADNTPYLPQLRNWPIHQKQTVLLDKQLPSAYIGRGKSNGTRKIALRWVLAIALLLILGLFDHPVGYAMANLTDVSPCSNSVEGGVYQDLNGNGVHERNEPFLAGTIQVVSSASAVSNSIESVDGLFLLDNLACDEYAVYHNGDYVGEVAIGEVMGPVLIELPKTTLHAHIFIPLVMR